MQEYSVLMSVYYKENPEYFELAVKSMLEQTVKPSDFVLVCDGPLTDELDSVIEKFKNDNAELFQVIRNEKNQGLGLALQQGLRFCKYDLVARMDADDIAVPDRMEKQLKAFADNPQASVIGGQIAEFEDDISKVKGYRRVPLSHEEIKERIAFRNPMNHMTVTFKKEYVIEVGSYQDFKLFEDYHLWARMMAYGHAFENINDTCVYARVDDNMYKRRAGMDYFKQTVRLQKLLKEWKLITWFQYMKNLVIRFVGTVVVSNKIRSILYNVFLRKREIE